MEISVSYYTAKGRRSVNQDAVSILENGRTTLAIVADGLGGHDAGEIAANQAVRTINHMLQSSDPSQSAIIHAISQANSDINALQNATQKMRTTVAVLWLDNGLAIAANVGDTRIYQFRNGKIIYQSLDHSVAQMAVLVGELRPEDIRKSADKNKLIRVLGDNIAPKAGMEVLTVQPGDRFLICSDGFWGVVTEDAMVTSMQSEPSAQKWLERMRREIDAFSDPMQDNHTAIALVIN